VKSRRKGRDSLRLPLPLSSRIRNKSKAQAHASLELCFISTAGRSGNLSPSGGGLRMPLDLMGLAGIRVRRVPYPHDCLRAIGRLRVPPSTLPAARQRGRLSCAQLCWAGPRGGLPRCRYAARSVSRPRSTAGGRDFRSLG
jgi:hypothetical protein